MKHELAKTLTIALVNYLDENRPEGTMDCSSGECVSLENALAKENFDSVETLINKKLSRLTEFEKKVCEIIIGVEAGEITPYDGERVQDMATRFAVELLAIAKKELARRDEVITLDKLPPYDKGLQDGKAEAMADLERTFECNPDKLPIWLKKELDRIRLESRAEGYSEGLQRALEGNKKQEFPLCWEPPCYHGGPCTNPQMDCINCPRKTTGVMFNTSSGTSTLKAEE